MASPLFFMCVLLVILFCFHSYSCENFQSESSYRLSDSDLRKKFLQPRTTMWRAVKRLERNGVIEIEKKDLQNLVKLRNNMEEEE